MRFCLIVLTALFFSGQAISQSACKRSSALFQFDQHSRPKNFTEKLGNHPQFPFLQHENGITTRALFIQSIKDPENRKKYSVEFEVFNRLLKDIGFVHGYKDVKAANVENLFINPGTIGNLGFFNKESNYTYVRLNPAGEGDDGIAAWRVTGPRGCSFYILHTCGNAFFASDPSAGGPACCKDIGVKVKTDTLATGDSLKRPLHISITFYQGVIGAGKKRGTYDTAYQLIRTIDTTTIIKDSTGGRKARVYGREMTEQWVLCRDTVLMLHIPLTMDTTSGNNKIEYTLSDTSYVRHYSPGKDDCHKKWEIAADGGASFNSIPRFDNTTQHTRTNGAQPMASLAFSRIFSSWFQAGVSAAYMTLSYQDDIAYPGAAPNTYNTVYPAKPVIPVQLFAKATIGGPLGWQANVTLSGGYSFVSGTKIVNSGTTLTTKPATKNGPTAGVGMGIAYFFSCKFGIGLMAGGQYFNNKASTMTYNLVALPVTLGIRFRF
jgi:hypothetical protein